MYFKKAYDILYKVYVDGEYVGDSMRLLSGEDKAIVTRLVYGVLERETELQYYISSMTRKTPKKPIGIILRLGMYSISYMDSLPHYAVCDKLVELTKKLKKIESAPFVNATLKGFIRQKPALPEKREERLSVLSSTPLWITKKLLRQYKEDGEKILFAEGERGSHIRASKIKYSNAELKALLDEKGIVYRESKHGFYVEEHSAIYPLFEEGKITYQSPSSIEIAELCAEGAREILDVCAAPGGKSVYMYELTGGRITACDLHFHRVGLIISYAKRMGAKINALAQDATKRKEEFVGKFDAVLCDVPCSGIGVRYSKPDTLINRKESDIPELCKIQEAIIENSSAYVKEGGRLVYSTCTIFNEENERVVRRFLDNHPEFCVDKEIKILPAINGKDGFYAVRLVRK